MESVPPPPNLSCMVAGGSCPCALRGSGSSFDRPVQHFDAPTQGRCKALTLRFRSAANVQGSPNLLISESSHPADDPACVGYGNVVTEVSSVLPSESERQASVAGARDERGG